MRKLLELGLIFVMSLYVIRLYMTNDIAIYIHPRYITFTVAASVAALAVSLIGLISIFYNKTKLRFDFQILKKHRYTLLLIIFVLVLGFGLKPMPLSAGTVEQRSLDLNNAVTNAQDIDLVSLYDKSTTKYSIADWVRAFNQNNNPDFFKKKSVDIVGFVYHERAFGEDIFLTSRFVITCCAVDVRPIGIHTKLENWKDQFRQSDWVRVKGVFDVEEVDGQKTVVIKVDSIEKTEQPDYPYIY